MIIIKAIETEKGIQHESEIPMDAVQVVCNGKEYVVYQDGDVLPKEIVYE